jgi:hypothetical protein
MTEQEWLACADPGKLLEFEAGRVSDRKLRLLACAFARRVWHRNAYDWSRRQVEVAEAYLEGAASPRDAEQARAQAEEGFRERIAARQERVHAGVPAAPAAHAVNWAALPLDPQEPVNERIDSRRRPLMAAQQAAVYAARAAGAQPGAGAAEAVEGVQEGLCGLARCVFGSPFRPGAFEPAWRTADVARLAAAAYEHRHLPSGHLDAARLAVLADALEEAGCTDADVLNHCRRPGVHVRGCWVVDLLLGQS